MPIDGRSIKEGESIRNLKILFSLLISTVPVCAAKITNGEQLIKAMHGKYAGKWYKTLAFSTAKKTKNAKSGVISAYYQSLHRRESEGAVRETVSDDLNQNAYNIFTLPLSLKMLASASQKVNFR